MSTNIFLTPPLVFLISLLAIWVFSKLASSVEHVRREAEGKTEPYACGEEYPAEKATPEYGQFFPFAIFFTVLHVAGLMLATFALSSHVSVFWQYGGFYILAIAITLAMLFVE
jgi:NADH:ubiquinone oxidoreductase subunit 3 (subunit A)